MLLRLVRLADARERLTESEWPQLASCHDGDVAGEQAAEVHPSKVANVWQCRTCVGLSAVHRGAERLRHAPPILLSCSSSSTSAGSCPSSALG